MKNSSFIGCCVMQTIALLVYGDDPRPLESVFINGESKSVDIVYLSDHGWPVHQVVSPTIGSQIIAVFAAKKFNWQPATNNASADVVTPLAAITWTDSNGTTERVSLHRDAKGNWMMRFRGETYRCAADGGVRDNTWRIAFQPAAKQQQRNQEISAKAPYFIGDMGLTIQSNIDLGEFIGRISVADPNGEKLKIEMLENSRRDALPKGTVSLDTTGDVYLADPTKLPINEGNYSIQVRATNTSGAATESAVIITTYGREGNSAIDAIKVQQLPGRQLLFDFRPTSVTAAGETMFTTLEINGKPLPIGAAHTAAAEGINYGTYQVKRDGTLLFQLDPEAMKNPKLYVEDSVHPGQQTLSLPPITVLLVSEDANTKDLKVLASGVYGE